MVGHCTWAHWRFDHPLASPGCRAKRWGNAGGDVTLGSAALAALAQVFVKGMAGRETTAAIVFILADGLGAVLGDGTLLGLAIPRELGLSHRGRHHWRVRPDLPDLEL